MIITWFICQCLPYIADSCTYDIFKSIVFFWSVEWESVLQEAHLQYNAQTSGPIWSYLLNDLENSVVAFTHDKEIFWQSS